MLTNLRDVFGGHARYSFLLCNSNFVFKTRRRFYDIRLQKCRDLEMG